MADVIRRQPRGQRGHTEPKKRLFGRLRSRHPYASRAIRNLGITAAVTAPMALVSRGKFRGAARLFGEAKGGRGVLRDASRAQAKSLHRSGIRWRRGAVVTGMTGTTASVLSPLERWDFERRGIAQGTRKPHPVLVQSRKTGERRVFYT